MVFAFSPHLVQEQIPAVHWRQQILVFPTKGRRTGLPSISKLPQSAEGRSHGKLGATRETGLVTVGSFYRWVLLIPGHSTASRAASGAVMAQSQRFPRLEEKTWTKIVGQNVLPQQGPWDPTIQGTQTGLWL